MENTFNLQFEENMDKLERKKKKSSLWTFVRRYKIITLVFVAFFVLSIINFYLMYSFVVILTNVM